MKGILRNAATSEENKERIPPADSPSNTQLQQQTLISGDHLVSAMRGCRGSLPAGVLQSLLVPCITTKSIWEFTAKIFTHITTMKKTPTTFSPHPPLSRSCITEPHKVFTEHLFKLWEGNKHRVGSLGCLHRARSWTRWSLWVFFSSGYSVIIFTSSS